MKENYKVAGQFIKSFDLDENDFPIVKEMLTRSGIRFFLYRNLTLDKSHKDYMPLEKIEDLLSGDVQLMKLFVEELTGKNKLVEAFGIMRRNKLENKISI